MHRMAATMLIALAWCFLSIDERTDAPRSSATYSLELRVTDPSARNGNDLVVIVKLGPNGTSKFSMGRSEPMSLTQYFKSWRNEAMDTLFKRLHMA
jgi:hypothetical protein